jgi:hypothetical protein
MLGTLAMELLKRNASQGRSDRARPSAGLFFVASSFKRELQQIASGVRRCVLGGSSVFQKHRSLAGDHNG